VSDALPTELRLIRVEPQPDYIESSGRWDWPLPEHARFPGCCTSVCTASREWWEYAPSEAKPHPYAEGVRLRDDVWYWAVPVEPTHYDRISILCHNDSYTVQVPCASWHEAAQLRERLSLPETKHVQ
jgi:hypothetical protein